jgi:hypothetical protein
VTLTEEVTTTEAEARPSPDAPITVTRRRIDTFLVWSGGAVAVILLIAGALLTWGSTFAGDYVHDELAAQAITFPPAAALEEEGRDDLVGFADQQVDTGEEAEAYASFIAGHIEGIAEGQTYAELGDVQFGLQDDLAAAEASGAPQEEVAAIQEDLDAVNAQRDSVFRGEMLRGTLLNTFAWSTMGMIAGYAAIVAFAGAAVMIALVVAGLVHLRRMGHTA